MEKQKPPTPPTDEKPAEKVEEKAPRQYPRRGKETLAPEPEQDDEPKSAIEGIMHPAIAERGGFVKQSGDPNRGVMEAIKRAGSQRALAEIMKVTQATINSWLWDKIPAERVLALEEKMGVSRRILRPDIFAVEPELVVSKPAFKNSVHRERYGKIEE